MTKEIVQIELDVEELRERAFIFDPHNPNWTGNPEHNMFFLHAHQNFFNDLLRARGHVLLNDILETIGMVRTIEGSIVGWALSFQEPAFIEFKTIHRGVNNSIDIKFNIQGIVVDKMTSAHDISVAQHDTTSPE